MHVFVLRNDLLEDYYFHYWIYGGVAAGYGDRPEGHPAIGNPQINRGLSTQKEQIAGDTGVAPNRLGTVPYAE